MKTGMMPRSLIARQYDALPLVDYRAIPAWRCLAEYSVRRAAEIRARLRVVVTDNPKLEYPDNRTMNADIRRGNFVVSSAFSQHPLWSVEENVAFRIVHDVDGHFVAGDEASFDWSGEILACAAHERNIPSLAKRALDCECIGQVAYAIENGHFGVQKIGFIDLTNE